MTAVEKQQQYWAITIEEAQRLYKAKVWDATAYLLAIIKTHGAAGWKWSFKVREFCQQWQIPERTFYRALSKLRSLHLVFWEAQDKIVLWWQDIHLSDSVEAPNPDSSKAPPPVTVVLPDVAEPLSQVAEALPDVAEPLSQVAEALPDVAEEKLETIDIKGVEQSPIFSSSSSHLFTNSLTTERPVVCGFEKVVNVEGVNPNAEPGVRAANDPDAEAIAQILGELKAMWIPVNEGIRRAVKKYWCNVPAALASVRAAQKSWKVKPDYNWGGQFIKFCKEPEAIAESFKGSAENYVPVRLPSPEQLEILQQARWTGLIKDFYKQPSSRGDTYVVDTGGGCIGWEEAIAQLQQQEEK